jgi:ubiquinone/menaquinone biosynthesis C-methylase UbiE
MRILDLGCGAGRELRTWHVSAADHVTGIDINDKSLRLAKERFPQRKFLRGAGERIPLKDATFDRVIAGVALPYMNIPRALGEIRRVLVPGGTLSLSLHQPQFTWSELVQNAFPKPIPTLFRFYVISNGIRFHSTGRTLGFVKGRTESFQTERGMKLALRRSGFVDFCFRRRNGRAGEVFIAEARKPLAFNSVSRAA